jgi:DNA integrity scanning protein DisA with diadenylate cyclase activity
VLFHRAVFELLTLLLLARQDGATVVDENGLVKTTMTILHPPPDVRVEEETDRGARHTTASKVSGATAALTIAVSEDGTITLYSKGRRLLRMMG